MSALARSLMAKTVPALKQTLIPNRTIVSGPPKYRISTAEKAITGILMCIVTVTPAAWVLMNIENYKKRN